MADFVKCKACGYIMLESKVKDVCPACGLPAKVFEPYKSPLSEKRKKILDLHLHPILVHFPQAFATLIPFFLIAGMYFPLPFKDQLLISASVFIYLLPLAVIPAMAAGFLDGHTRFKSVKTPILVKKAIAGIVLFVLSAMLAMIAYAYGITNNNMPWLVVLSIACVACEVVLGKLGESIMESKLPG